MHLTFSVILRLTELKFGLIEIFIIGIGPDVFMLSQSLLTDVCIHSNTQNWHAILYFSQCYVSFHVKGQNTVDQKPDFNVGVYCGLLYIKGNVCKY